LGNGHFQDVSALMGPGISEGFSSRGAAFGDYDNDGCMDVLVLNMNDLPSLRNWSAGACHHRQTYPDERGEQRHKRHVAERPAPSFRSWQARYCGFDRRQMANHAEGRTIRADQSESDTHHSRRAWDRRKIQTFIGVACVRIRDREIAASVSNALLFN